MTQIVTNGQSRAKRACQFDALDIPHLVEELTSLGKSEQRELLNRLRPLLGHLLKLAIAAQRLPNDLQRAGRGWRATVKTQRLHVAQVLRDNPSLRSTVPRALGDAYESRAGGGGSSPGYRGGHGARDLPMGSDAGTRYRLLARG